MHISVSTEPATGSSFRTHGDTQKPVSDFLTSDTGFPLSHKNSLCYIFSFLIPLAAIVAGIYLLTQKNEDVHKHGTCIIIIAIGVMCISYLYYIKFL